MTAIYRLNYIATAISAGAIALALFDCPRTAAITLGAAVLLVVRSVELLRDKIREISR